ncbi:hypothetical protein NIES2101_08690 [Calothrix sp. HK-06]|nr:hypothetical protein NIES2101_08690 [Calothrix sp. HK-06]
MWTAKYSNLNFASMDYINKINHLLKPSTSGNLLVVDLFAGCGGLSLGFEAQGIETHGFEMDSFYTIIATTIRFLMS